MQNLKNPWNPWKELNQIENEMNRLFGRRFGKPAVPVGYPAVNLWADDHTLLLTAEIPGFEPEQLDITVNRNSIVLSGKRDTVQPQSGETYYRKERPSASFTRTLELPIEVDPESAEADYSKGVLTVRLSRPAAHQPKKVTVKAV
jgi:HSP20 family protein